ncbi:DUF397 domain-containing protein [Actinocorallia aurantiaca]|uniref:DUF397 domain-containing protein n=1 Tax=Actinocorallia aurantiaca TaxID=46204 RepID=A0ABN3U3H8_9ACTN
MNTPARPPVPWRKNTHSGSEGDNCVEVAAFPGTVAVRDSKHPDSPRLAFTRPAFASFTRRLRTGRHDL